MRVVANGVEHLFDTWVKGEQWLTNEMQLLLEDGYQVWVRDIYKDGSGKIVMLDADEHVTTTFEVHVS